MTNFLAEMKSMAHAFVEYDEINNWIEKIYILNGEP